MARVIDSHMDVLPGYISVDAAAIAADASLWVAVNRELRRYANDDWSMLGVDGIHTKVSNIVDIGFDHEGRAWVVTNTLGRAYARDLYRQDDTGRWQRVNGSSTPTRLHRHPDGRLYVQSQTSLFEAHDPETFVAVPLGAGSVIAHSATLHPRPAWRMSEGQRASSPW